MNAYGNEPLASKCLGINLVNAKAAVVVSDCSWAVGQSPGENTTDFSCGYLISFIITFSDVFGGEYF